VTLGLALDRITSACVLFARDVANAAANSVLSFFQGEENQILALDAFAKSSAPFFPSETAANMGGANWTRLDALTDGRADVRFETRRRRLLAARAPP
jgi:hypothetical protein